MYSRNVLEKFVPSVAAEPVELDARDENDIKRVAYAELENASGQQMRASIHHEVHIESSPTVPQRKRKDSARDLNETRAVTETIMGNHTIILPPLPFTRPPAVPPRQRGFDPGALEAAIEAAFG